MTGQNCDSRLNTLNYWHLAMKKERQQKEGKYSQQPLKQPVQECHKREAHHLPFYTLKQYLLPMFSDDNWSTDASTFYNHDIVLPCCNNNDKKSKRYSGISCHWSWLKSASGKIIHAHFWVRSRPGVCDHVTNWLRPVFLSTYRLYSPVCFSCRTLSSAE